MLSEQDNALLTQVGPGTAMGALLREYWMPAMLSRELPGPDCDPVRVLLVGERLIAFRDSNGKVGLLDHSCPHRGASLFFGRNEECGLRCVYHGWKFDTEGNCVDIPNEPDATRMTQKIKARAYPTQERGGVIWAYLGPRTVPPPLPHLAGNMVEGAADWVFAMQLEANWVQILEGDIDTSHVGFLHFGSVRPEDVPPDTFASYQLLHRNVSLDVIDIEAGLAYGGRRPAANGNEYWRIAEWLFPFYSFTPTSLLGVKHDNICRVPMDDTHTMYIRMYDGSRFHGRHPSQPDQLPNTADWYGRFRTVQNPSNDFLLDRSVQRGNRGQDGYTGIHFAQMQDSAVTTSMGPIVDRSKEHLGTTDKMVSRMRHRLLAAVKEYVKEGTTPPGVDNPEAYAVRSGGVILPEGSDWVAATENLRKAFVEVETADPSIVGPIS